MIIFAILAILIYKYKLNLGKNIVKIAREVLLNESQAISQVAEFIDDAFATCVQEISTKGLGATAVVDELGSQCGIITDGDLRRTMQYSEDISHLKASVVGYSKTLEKALMQWKQCS